MNTSLLRVYGAINGAAGLLGFSLCLVLLLLASESAQAQLKLSNTGNVTVGTTVDNPNRKLRVKCNTTDECREAVIDGRFEGNFSGSVIGVQGTAASGGRGYGGYFTGGSTGVYGTGNVLGVEGVSSGGTGVFGNGSTGVEGVSDTGVGVRGTGGTYGVFGVNTVNNGQGVRGEGDRVGVFGDGGTYGVEGVSAETGVRGYGIDTGVSGEGDQYGVRGVSPSGASGTGVRGTGDDFGVAGESRSGVDGTGILGTGDAFGMRGKTRGSGVGVVGSVGSLSQNELDNLPSAGVFGAAQSNYGVYGQSESSTGVRGQSGDTGVEGRGDNVGVRGVSSEQVGVYASGGRYGVYAVNPDDPPIGNEGRIAAGARGQGPVPPPEPTQLGYGGYFRGRDVGVEGFVDGRIDLPFTGMTVGGHFTAQGSAGTKAGVMGEASGSGNLAGVYGKAPVRNGSYAGFFQGDIGVTGEVVTVNLRNLSDRRLKEEIRDLAGAEALALVEGLRPRRYRFRAGFGSEIGSSVSRIERLGFVAQEVEAVLPELVREQVLAGGAFQRALSGADEGLYKSVDYVSLVPVLTAALQAQQNEISELKSAMQMQQAQINELLRALTEQGFSAAPNSAR